MSAPHLKGGSRGLLSGADDASPCACATSRDDGWCGTGTGRWRVGRSGLLSPPKSFRACVKDSLLLPGCRFLLMGLLKRAGRREMPAPRQVPFGTKEALLSNIVYISGLTRSAIARFCQGLRTAEARIKQMQLIIKSQSTCAWKWQLP